MALPELVPTRSGGLSEGVVMPESLAVRRANAPAAITRVNEVLDAFAARDYNGELLTAVRHFPAREAQWADFPAWVHLDLATAYAAKGIRRLYTHQAEAAEAIHAGKGPHRPDQSGHATHWHSPASHALDAPLRKSSLHCARRVAHLSRRLRQPLVQCFAPPPPHRPILRPRSAICLLLRDDRQSRRIGLTPSRIRSRSPQFERRSRRGENFRFL